MHIREAIVEAVIAVLTLGVPSVSTNVFKGRVTSMDEASLPGICVFTTGEEATLVTTAGMPRSSERILNLSIEIFTQDSDILSSLNDIAEQVELAMYGDNTLGGLVLDLYAMSWEESLNADMVDRAQGKKTGVGTMVYQLLYVIKENNPTAED